MIYFEDFVRDLHRCPSAEAAQRLLQHTVEALGFVSFDYASGVLKTPKPRSSADVDIVCYLSTLDWGARYIEQGYQEVDRFGRTALAGLLPVSYRDILAAPAESRKQWEMEGEIADQGIRSGLIIPLHAPGGRSGVMSLGSRLSPEEFGRMDRETRPLVHLISTYFNAFMMQQLWPPEEVSPLSGRERECLLWSAKGKTAWETSCILGVSESMVKKHLAAAALKLDAATRTQAVAKAMALGLISV